MIDLLLNVYEDILRFMRNTSPMFFVDMERYYPRVNDKYENDKECHKQATVDLLKEGVGEGVIRADINMEIVATLLTFQFVCFWCKSIVWDRFHLFVILVALIM